MAAMTSTTTTPAQQSPPAERLPRQERVPPNPRPIFIFVNKSTDSWRATPIEAARQLAVVRRHARINANLLGGRKQRIVKGAGSSSAARIAAGGFSSGGRRGGVRESEAVSTTVSNGVRAGVDEHQRPPQHECVLGPPPPPPTIPHNEPGRALDAFRAAPMALTPLAIRVLDFHMTASRAVTRGSSCTPSAIVAARGGRASLSVRFASIHASSLRWHWLMHETMRRAFARPLAMACLLALQGGCMARVYGNLGAGESRGLLRGAVGALGGVAVVGGEARGGSEMFAAVHCLFLAEAYAGRTEQAVAHARSAHAVWALLGGWEGVEEEVMDLFLATAFLHQFVDYWDAAVISPFAVGWDRVADWPPRVEWRDIRDEDGGEARDVLNLPVIAEMMRDHLDFARLVQKLQGRVREGANDGVDVPTIRRMEQRNLFLRQRLMALQTDDLRVHVWRRCMHMLVSMLAGYEWLRETWRIVLRYVQVDVVAVSDEGWLGQEGLRTLCVLTGAIFETGDEVWFAQQLASLLGICGNTPVGEVLESLKACGGDWYEAGLVQDCALSMVAVKICRLLSTCRRESPSC
jgi:hypothetical protein